MRRWTRILVLAVVGVALFWGGRTKTLAQQIYPDEIIPTSSGGVMFGFPTGSAGDTSTGYYLIPGSVLNELRGGGGSTAEGGGDKNPIEFGRTGYEYENGEIAGFYKAPNGKYYRIQVTPSSGGGDEGGGPPRCACGTMQKECERDCDGDDCTRTCEQYCSEECPPPTCASAYPQQLSTSKTSGDFYIYISGAYGGQNNAGYHGPSVLVDVWSASGGQDDYHRYEAVNYGTGKYYLKFDLASHPGMGTIHVHPIVRNWPYGLYTSCPEADFQRISYISGRVYYDPTGTCSTAQPWTQTSDLVVGYNNGGVATAGQVISSGDYAGIYFVGSSTVSNVSLQLINKPDEYMCSDCNTTTCPNRVSAAAGSTNNDFFLTDLPDPWWQVTGAGIYAGGAGVAVKSQLPDSSMRLILAEAGGTGGAMFTAAGNSDLGKGSVSDAGWVAKTTYRGKRMDYNYFAAAMGCLAY